MHTTLFYILILLLSIEFLFSRLLDWLNLRHIREDLPDEMRGFYDEEEYTRSQRYMREKSRFGLVQSVLGFVVVMLVLFFDLFAWLDSLTAGWTSSELMHSLFFFALLGLASSLGSLPFSAYLTFVIEERYGFNKTTARTFILDMLKSGLLAIILGGGVLSLVIWIYLSAGNLFWVLAWGVITVISVLMSLFYSDLIVPLFNKQRPLEEGELRTAIEGYAGRVGFSLRDIYVIDGSKRSSKANAYFTGFGPRKRIVLYDTLVQDHSVEEIVAILAHEAGHDKHRHVLKGLVLSILNTGVMLFVLGLFIAHDSSLASTMAAALGTGPSFHIGVLVFGILFSPLSTLTGLGMNYLSRRYEYQADAFAASSSDGESLAAALKRLSVKHLSNLYPHPWYVWFHYSHPPLLERLKALRANAS